MNDVIKSFAEIETAKVVEKCEHAIEFIYKHKERCKEENLREVLALRNSRRWFRRKPYTDEEILAEAKKNPYLKAALDGKVNWYEHELDLANKLLVLAASTDSKVMYISAEDWFNVYKFGA